MGAERVDLLEELCVRGIRLNFWGAAGKPYALISSPYLNATIQTRRDTLLSPPETMISVANRMRKLLKTIASIAMTIVSRTK